MRTRFLAIILFFEAAIAGGMERAVAGDVFQWVDPNGVIHFTDDYESIPIALRGTPEPIVRHRFVEAQFIEPVTLPSAQEPSAACQRRDNESARSTARSEVNEECSDNSATSAELAQGATVIVVHSFASHVMKPCHKAGGCTGRFQPDFNDRRYIHPSVFNGGSRQYVQPRLFPPARNRSGLRIAK